MRAKDFIPASKPRNFVAKNQKTAGAGAHRDKKKEQKQGYEKHKGKGVAEGSDPVKDVAAIRGAIARMERELQDPNPHLDREAIKKRIAWEKRRLNLYRDVTDKEQGVAEGISVVDQDYDLDQVILTLDIEGKKTSFTYTDYDENFKNAERKDVFDQLQNNSWYKGLDHPTKMEILDAAYKAIRGEEPSEYKPTVGDEPLEGSMMEYETHRYTDAQGNEWEVDDEGNRELIRRGYGRSSSGSDGYTYRKRFRPAYTKPKGYYFYNVPAGKESDARAAGLRQSKSGKWFDTMTNSAAEKVFGKGRYWEPKN